MMNRKVLVPPHERIPPPFSTSVAPRETLESLQEGSEKSRDPRDKTGHRRNAEHLCPVWMTFVKPGPPPQDSPSSSQANSKPGKTVCIHIGKRLGGRKGSQNQPF